MSHKILSIDDSKTIRMIVERTLKRFDCVFCEAANGEEGLAVAASERPDIIVLDHSMPGMDGVTMLGKLREDETLRGIPVMMLTAESSNETLAQMAQLGVRECLAKPFKHEHFVEKISRIIPLVEKAAA